MSHETPNDDLNQTHRLSAALQAALREATPGDLTPSMELRSAIAAQLAMAPYQPAGPNPDSLLPNSSFEVTPMSKHESKSGWGRVAATFIASGVAAALAISIFLPANEQAQQAARREQAIRDEIASRTRAEFDRMLKDEEAIAQDINELSKLPRPGGIPPDSVPSDPTVTEFSLAVVPATTTDILADTGDFHAIIGPTGNASPGNSITGRAVVGRAKKSIAGGGIASPHPAPAADPYGVAPAAGGSAISGPASANPQQQENKAGRLMFGTGVASSAAPAPPGQAQPNNSQQHFSYTTKPEIGYTITKPVYADTGKNPRSYSVPKPGEVVDTRNVREDEIRFKRYDLFSKDQAAPTAATPLPALKNPEQSSSLQTMVTPQGVIKEEAPPARLLSFPQSYENKPQDQPIAQPSGEQFEQRVENIFQGVRAEPLSTFSIDVDTASYTNCRRFLDGRQLPPTAAVRVEEFINYFRYDYPQPTGKDPFSVNMEMADCPWTPNHKLLRIGLKGKEIDRRERPESNLVFLVDVSGSMSSEDKLPLLRDALHRWVNELSANDRVTIVTYAGDAGLRLPTTRGDQKDKLHAAIETLQSGGSTHGSAGIKLAYEEATKNFLENGGVNRVLWATDGDLNVGTTSDDELVELITNKAKTGVFLTVLGVGTGNLKDAKLEKMADKGNGVYAYLDSPKEARKVLIEQMSGTTITIAKDVKIQIEFNPTEIAGYRLIGYENRMLAAEDFANDKKDAGEIGAGHTVTALYELIPVDAVRTPEYKGTEKLKYQDTQSSTRPDAAPAQKLNAAAISGELLTLSLRFKQPDGHKSELREFPLKERGGKFTAASKDFQFAGCVAQLAMILRDSQYRGQMTTAAIAEIAAATKGEDKDGSRQEFVELVKRVQELGK